MIINDTIDSFVTADTGESLPIRVWTPPGRAHRVVVALHGMVTHSGWFHRMSTQLVTRGIAVIAPDRRGNGYARHLPRIDDPDQLIRDVHAVVRFAATIADEVCLLSWCGSANFAVPAATGIPLQRFVMASPGLVPLPVMSARFREAEPVDGFLPVHFDPAADFTDDEALRATIHADRGHLRRIPLALRETWRQLNPRARAALRELRIPTECVLTRIDRMIDIPATVELLGEIPVRWASGGHGFLVEPSGATLMAEVLAS